MSTSAAPLEQALARSDAGVDEVLDLVDEAVERAAAEGDGAALGRLADRLDEVAAQRGGEWRGLAVAAARARTLTPPPLPSVPSPTRTLETPPTVPSPAPVVETPPPTAVAAPAAVVYSGVWRRVAAFLLDLVVIGFGSELLGAPGGVVLAGTLVYFVVFPFVADGATVGKLVLGMAIRRADGSEIGFMRSLVRVLVFFVLWITVVGLIADVIVAGTDRRRQSIHDKVADTIVVRTR